MGESTHQSCNSVAYRRLHTEDPRFADRILLSPVSISDTGLFYSGTDVKVGTSGSNVPYVTAKLQAGLLLFTPRRDIPDWELYRFPQLTANSEIAVISVQTNASSRAGDTIQPATQERITTKPAIYENATVKVYRYASDSRSGGDYDVTTMNTRVEVKRPIGIYELHIEGAQANGERTTLEDDEKYTCPIPVWAGVQGARVDQAPEDLVWDGSRDGFSAYGYKLLRGLKGVKGMERDVVHGEQQSRDQSEKGDWDEEGSKMNQSRSPSDNWEFEDQSQLSKKKSGRHDGNKDKPVKTKTWASSSVWWRLLGGGRRGRPGT